MNVKPKRGKHVSDHAQRYNRNELSQATFSISSEQRHMANNIIVFIFKHMDFVIHLFKILKKFTFIVE